MIIRFYPLTLPVFIAAAVTAIFPVVAMAAPEGTAGNLVIESADYMKYNRDRKVTTFRGDVLLKFQDRDTGDVARVGAGHAVVSEELKVTTAWRGVTLSSGDTRMTASMLQYRYREKKFEATGVSGSTEGGKGVRGRVYFEAEKAWGDGDKIKLAHADISTCGPECPSEYHMRAADVSIYPEKKIIARKVGIYLRNTRVMYLPVYVHSLKEEESYMPEFGYNKTEGFYVKSKYPYLAKDTIAGWLIFDYMDKIGNRYGADHKYESGRLGGDGRIIATTNQQKDSGASNNVVSFTQQLKPSDRLNGNISYNRNSSYIQNRPGSRTNQNRMNLNLNYRQAAAKTVGLVYNFAANKGRSLSENEVITINRKTALSKKLSLFYTYRQSSAQSGTNPANIEGYLTTKSMYRQKLYTLTVDTYKDFDLDGDTYPNDTSMTVERQKLPEAKLSLSNSLWAKKLPVLKSLEFIHGRYRQGRRNHSSGLRRSEIAAKAMKTLKRGKLTLTPQQNLYQRFYSTGDAMYVMEHTTRAQYDFNKEWRLTSNYRKTGDSGGTPKSQDRRSEQITLDGNLALNKSSRNPITGATKKTTSFSMSTSYNYRTYNYAPLSLSYFRRMTQNSMFTIKGSKDLNRHEWNNTSTNLQLERKNTKVMVNAIWDTKEADLRSMNFQTEHIRSNGWKFSVRGQYAHKSQHGIIRNIIATKTRCCTQLNFFYNTEQDEFRFQYTINAFPSQKFGFTKGPQGLEMDESMWEIKSEETQQNPIP